ncbi:MAG: proton-conducting transporter membrane subunit [Anaerolineae bacterium]
MIRTLPWPDLAPALLLVALPLGALPVVYLLRRWTAGALLAAGVCAANAYLAFRLPRTEVWTLLGSPVKLDALAVGLLSVLFIAAAVLFLMAWRIPQGWSFYPFGLLTLGLWVAASLSHHLGVTALLIELAAIVLVFVIQGGRANSTRAAWRFLVMISLAVPLFLLAAWRIDLYRADVNNAIFLNEARVLVAVGFAIWLAVVPLHSWLTTLAGEAQPLVAAFVLIGFPLVVLITLFHLVADAPWLADTPEAMNVLLVAGLLTATLGGALAAVQRSFGALLGYAALADIGCSVVMLAVGGTRGSVVLLLGLVMRTLALTLAGAAGAALRFRAGGDAFALAPGLARSMPLTVAGFTIGGLALAGAPLTAGFTARWFLLEAAANLDLRWALIVVLAGLGVAIGYLRGLRSLLALPEGGPGRAPPGESWLSTSVIVLLALLCLSLGVFPQSVVNLAQEIAAAFPLPLL